MLKITDQSEATKVITDTFGHVHFCIKQVETRFKNKNMLKITDQSEATKVLLKLTEIKIKMLRHRVTEVEDGGGGGGGGGGVISGGGSVVGDGALYPHCILTLSPLYPHFLLILTVSR